MAERAHLDWFRGRLAASAAIEPKHPAPVYDPSVVADAILFCAEHSRRDLIIGSGGKMTAAITAE